MLSRRFKATVAALVVAAGTAVAVAPAEAQYRRHHYRGDRGAAIGAGIALGIIGLGAAAIAAEERRRAYEESYYYAPRPRYYEGPAYYYEAPPRRVHPRRAPAVDERYPHTFRYYD